MEASQSTVPSVSSVPSAPTVTAAPPVASAPKSGFQCIAVLPGLGVYTDSSDSENNGDTDSDSEDDIHRRHPQAAAQQPRDITGRIVKPVTQSSSSGAAAAAAQGGC